MDYVAAWIPAYAGMTIECGTPRKTANTRFKAFCSASQAFSYALASRVAKAFGTAL
jgi:hypothetical protein